MTIITFIMSVFNTRKEWIARAVESIKQQTNPKWELIIVDDGSNKVTADFLDEFTIFDSRIIVHHQENQGLSVARNYGMDNASGTWVAFIDADDWIEKDYVEQLMEVLKIHGELEVLAFGHDDIWKNKSINQLWGTNEYYEFSTDEREGMQLACLQDPKAIGAYPMFFGAQWKMIYSLEFLNKYSIRNTPGLYKSQDSVFNLYVTEYATRIAYYNKVLYHYFHNNESVTGGGFNRDTETWQRLVAAYKRFIEDTGKKNKLVYQIAYKKVALLRFESMERRCIFHKDNPDSDIKKSNELKRILSEEPYSSLLKETTVDGFSFYKKILFKTLQRGWYWQIKALYYIVTRLKRVRKNVIG